MLFLILCLFLSPLAFAIEGRGLTPQKEGESSATSTEPTQEIRKAELKNPPLNPLFKVTKVHEVRTDGNTDSHGNKALEFEQKYWMFGAVTKEQIDERKGQIYVITWVNQGVERNIEARLEYRQVNTKDVTRVFSIRYPMAKGANRSQFSVLGKAFQDGGPIQSYRFTLWSGDELLAESKSFIW